MVTVCIAIPTYNREQVLVDTIEEALAQDPPADEILVIDQTREHEPATEAFLRRHDEARSIRYIRQSPPNLPCARNRALVETGCDVLIYIDDDVKLPKDFADTHRRNYSDPKVVAVAGRVIQTGLLAPTREKWPPIMDHRFLPLDSTDRKEGVTTFRGCNHSVRASVLAEIGGYDKNYIGWAYREEADVAIRLWKAGGTIVYDPEARLTHLAIPTGGCRLVIDKKPLPEWQFSFPGTYFTIRHLFPNRWFWHDIFAGNVRRYILRKDNVFRPWRLPWAALSYAFSVCLAAWLCMSGRTAANRPFEMKQ